MSEIHSIRCPNLRCKYRFGFNKVDRVVSCRKCGTKFNIKNNAFRIHKIKFSVK